MATSSTDEFLAISILLPHEVASKKKHTATMIFLHGLGDQGDGWADVFRSDLSIDYFKFIVPNAATRSITLNFGMRMPAWYDLFGLTETSREDDEGIEKAKNYVHSLIDKEINNGIDPRRIAIGGFSMGGALALYAGLTYNKPIGAIVVLSGFLLQRTKLPGSHTANLHTPVFMGHGFYDFLVPYSFGQRTEEALKVFNSKVEFHSYPVDHTTSDAEHNDVKAFLKKYIPEK